MHDLWKEVKEWVLPFDALSGGREEEEEKRAEEGPNCGGIMAVAGEGGRRREESLADGKVELQSWSLPPFLLCWCGSAEEMEKGRRSELEEKKWRRRKGMRKTRDGERDT